MGHILGTEKASAAAATQQPETFAVDTNIRITQKNLDEADEKVTAAINNAPAAKKSDVEILWDKATGPSPVSDAGVLMDMAETPVQWAAGAAVGFVGFLRAIVGKTAESVGKVTDVVVNGPPVDTAQKLRKAAEKVESWKDGGELGRDLRRAVTE